MNLCEPNTKTRLSIEKKEKEQLITTTQNSTIIGQVGEDFTLQELNKRFPRAEIEDTHKEKGRGDFIFKVKSSPTCPIIVLFCVVVILTAPFPFFLWIT